MSKSSPYSGSVCSIAEFPDMLQLPKPEHPLVSVVNLAAAPCISLEIAQPLSFDFYIISIKKGIQKAIKYGRSAYDFNEGIMAFTAPGQTITGGETAVSEGWVLIIHPDFLQGYPLASKIKEYGFFSYAVNEALHLSDKEEKTIESVLDGLRQEYQASIDTYSQDVMISQIELLLNYSNRFYGRQFITRKAKNNHLLAKLNQELDQYFEGNNALNNGLPSVQYLASQLALSPDYLSDMLRSLTGHNTQQHIHEKLIEKAKEKLSNTELTVSEIAFSLGFEHSQSFNKLFKTKTSQSPLEFRRSFN